MRSVGTKILAEFSSERGGSIMCVDVFNLGLGKNAKLRAQSFGSTAILDAT